MKLLHDNATAAGLARLRILVYGLWFVKILINPLAGLSDISLALFNPPGVLRLLPDALWNLLLTHEALWSLKILLLLALAGAAAGWRFRMCSAISIVLLVVQHGMMLGFTYVYHEEIPLLYAAAILLLFPCTDALAMEKRPTPPRPSSTYTAGFVSVAAMLCMLFFFTGVYRCVAGGLEVFTSDTLITWVMRNSAVCPLPWSWLGPAVVASPWGYAALKGGFVVATAIEVCAPLALVFLGFRRVFAIVMIVFFVLNTLVMNVVFWETALLMAIFFDGRPTAGGRPCATNSDSAHS